MENRRPPYWEWPLERLNVLILSGALVLLLGLSIVRFVTRDRAPFGPGVAGSPLPTAVEATATAVEDGSAAETAGVDTTAPQILTPARSDTMAQPLTQVAGSAPPGLTVELYDNQRRLGQTTAGADGVWAVTLDPPLAEGDHLLWVQTLDANGSAVSQSRNVMLSVLAPQPVSIVVPDATAPVMASRLQTIDGRATPGGLVRVWLDDDVLGDTQADPGGAWTYRLGTPLPLGLHRLHAALLSPRGDILERGTPLDLLLIP